MKLLYPRCCVLDVQQQLLLACLRLQDVGSPVHKEIRTFGLLASDVIVLSNWLAGHGVTHVAIEHSARAWKPLYQALQQAFTVLLINPTHVTDAKDIQRIADLLAYGLVQGQVITPAILQEAPRSPRRRRLAVVAMLFVMLLSVYGVLSTGSRVHPKPSPVPSPPSVRWQQLQMSYQYPAGKPFTLPLPTLERTPERVPVEVMLETSSAGANWLQLDRERLLMQGTPPITAEGQTYQLVVRAKAEGGSESQLRLSLTITGQHHPPQSATDPLPFPLPRSPQQQRPDRPPATDGVMKLWHSW
jgi:hypothetical protein